MGSSLSLLRQPSNGLASHIDRNNNVVTEPLHATTECQLPSIWASPFRIEGVMNFQPDKSDVVL